VTIEELVRVFNDKCSWSRLAPTWHLPTPLEMLLRTGGALDDAVVLDAGSTDSSRATYKVVVAFAAGLAVVEVNYSITRDETSLKSTFLDWASVSGLRLEAAFAPGDNPSTRWSLHLASPELHVSASRVTPEDDLFRLADVLLRHLSQPLASRPRGTPHAG
jgi:hypothetical protein